MREQDHYNQGEGHFEYTQTDLNDAQKTPATHNSKGLLIHDLREYPPTVICKNIVKSHSKETI